MLVSSYFDFTTVSSFLARKDTNLITRQDYRTLFRFLVSCMFADPAALGFDPTMTCLQSPNSDDSRTVQYDVLVRGADGGVQTYRTFGVLYDGGGDALVGRCTRVWKARRVDHSDVVGEPVALKDTWVDDHREREGSIDCRIRQSALSLSSDDRHRLEQSLLTIISHGDVLVGGATDCTRRVVLGDASGTPSTVIPCGDRKPLAKLQTHYRIVYREIGTPLRDESSLAVVFKALMEGCGGERFTLTILSRRS